MAGSIDWTLLEPVCDQTDQSTSRNLSDLQMRREAAARDLEVRRVETVLPIPATDLARRRRVVHQVRNRKLSPLALAEGPVTIGIEELVIG